jgi:hypothetical protein
MRKALETNTCVRTRVELRGGPAGSCPGLQPIRGAKTSLEKIENVVPANLGYFKCKEGSFKFL